MVQPGYEWHDTDHLQSGTNTYAIRFHRTGYDARDMGELIMQISHKGDTMILVRDVIRAGTQFTDTLITEFPGLMPIRFTSNQADRHNRYVVGDGVVEGTISYTNIGDGLEYSRTFDRPFFDLTSLGLVLGGVNHPSLESHSIKFFDPETTEFTQLEVQSVEREQIESVSGTKYNCNVFRGKVNQANTSIWIDRSSGKLIKTYTEMPANMAMEMRLK